jgi:hypothetical protein
MATDLRPFILDDLNPFMIASFRVTKQTLQVIWGSFEIVDIWQWVKTLVPSEPQNSW